jgi:flavin reductase (DIM6/NTAB) family NADH-FMN oxidoreductase RutF
MGELHEGLHRLDVDAPIWDRFYHVAPLIVVGTTEGNGEADLAPKHMATQLGWGNLFGFVCAPRHATYRNIDRTGVFTVSYPRPDQVVLASLAAAPRFDESAKPSLAAVPTFAATVVEGRLLEGGYLFFECELDRIVDGFGDNSLICGRIIAAYVDEASLRMTDADDSDIVAHAPLLAFLHPDRFASIDRAMTFPFHTGMEI